MLPTTNCLEEINGFAMKDSVHKKQSTSCNDIERQSCYNHVFREKIMLHRKTNCCHATSDCYLNNSDDNKMDINP
ncbi:hypothetical protein T06_11960 [Trichinella sp. T6]|nr:hypothetical protein T06_11960 [Trichinella sp. T6]